MSPHHVCSALKGPTGLAVGCSASERCLEVLHTFVCLFLDAGHPKGPLLDHVSAADAPLVAWSAPRWSLPKLSDTSAPEQSAVDDIQSLCHAAIAGRISPTLPLNVGKPCIPATSCVYALCTPPVFIL